MWRMVLVVGGLWIGPGCGVGLPALAQSCAPQSVIWDSGGETHDTVLLGRLRNGCPVLAQRRGPAGAAPRIALSGVDCDCDLRIDGREALFETPHAVVARRLVALCEANRALAVADAHMASMQTPEAPPTLTE